MLRSSGVLLLISLVCVVVAPPADRSQDAVDVKQLAGSLKLLQLQLRQAAETVEQLDALLTGSDFTSASAASLAEPFIKLAGTHIDNGQALQDVPVASTAAAGSLATSQQSSFSRTLAQQTTFWTDAFTMLTAVKADSHVNALCILTFHPDSLPANQLLVVSDATGTLYIFTSRGQLVLEHQAGRAINALAAHARTHEKALLLLGADDGSSQVLHVTFPNRQASLSLAANKENALHLSPATLPSQQCNAADQPTATDPAAASKECGEVEAWRGSSSKNGVVHVGWLRSGTMRQPVAVLADGQILIYRENGSLAASGVSDEPVTALQILGSSISLVTSSKVATVHVRVNSIALRSRTIVGLNQSIIVAAAFDQLVPQRVYAVTTDLDLLVLHIPGKTARDAQVMVRLALTLGPASNPVQLAHARGYLYLTTPTGVAVFNTTGHALRRPPKMVLAHPLSHVAAGLTVPSADAPVDSQSASPAAIAAAGGFAAVSVGEGVVGLFESKLFFKESSKLPLQALSRPLLIVAMLVVGGWQYTRTRRRQEQGAWPPDWGHGDASRFPDFPQLPKSRAQLVPPTESRHMRRAGSAGASGRRVQSETASREQPVHDQARRHAAHSRYDDMSAAELDAMAFRQQLPRPPKAT